MTVINLPRDDLGKQRLEEANAARNAALPVSSPASVAPLAPRANPNRPPVPVASQATPPVERRHGERRGGERRSQSHAVLLDTRSAYSRRTHDRRRPADTSQARRAVGLDVYS